MLNSADSALRYLAGVGLERAFGGSPAALPLEAAGRLLLVLKSLLEVQKGLSAVRLRAKRLKNLCRSENAILIAQQPIDFQKKGFALLDRASSRRFKTACLLQLRRVALIAKELIFLAADSFELSQRLIGLAEALSLNSEVKREAIQKLWLNAHALLSELSDESEPLLKELERNREGIDSLLLRLAAPYTADQLIACARSSIEAAEKLLELDNRTARTAGRLLREMAREGLELAAHTLLDWSPRLLLPPEERFHPPPSVRKRPLPREKLPFGAPG